MTTAERLRQNASVIEKAERLLRAREGGFMWSTGGAWCNSKCVPPSWDGVLSEEYQVLSYKGYELTEWNKQARATVKTFLENGTPFRWCMQADSCDPQFQALWYKESELPKWSEDHRMYYIVLSLEDWQALRDRSTKPAPEKETQDSERKFYTVCKEGDFDATSDSNTNGPYSDEASAVQAAEKTCVDLATHYPDEDLMKVYVLEVLHVVEPVVDRKVSAGRRKP